MIWLSYLAETLEESRVLAVVETKQVLVYIGNLMQDFQNFTSFDNLNKLRIRIIKKFYQKLSYFQSAQQQTSKFESEFFNNLWIEQENFGRIWK